MRVRSSGLVTAIGLFTLIPVPPCQSIDRDVARRAMASFPTVGLIVGAVAGLVDVGVTALASPLFGAVAGLVVLAAMTGGLHLDGLADTADGLGSRKPAEEALAIMKRSDIGPMGVVALVLTLLVDVAALAHVGTAALAHAGTAALAHVGTAALTEIGGVGVTQAGAGPGSGAPPGAAGGVPIAWTPMALVVAAASARTPILVATMPKVSTARPGGFGALFQGSSSAASVTANAVVTAVLSAGVGWLVAGLGGLVALTGGWLAAQLVGWWWQSRLYRRFGGMTGDTFGSIIEVSQAAFLVVTALVIW